MKDQATIPACEGTWRRDGCACHNLVLRGQYSRLCSKMDYGDTCVAKGLQSIARQIKSPRMRATRSHASKSDNRYLVAQWLLIHLRLRLTRRKLMATSQYSVRPMSLADVRLVASTMHRTYMLDPIPNYSKPSLRV